MPKIKNSTAANALVGIWNVWLASFIRAMRYFARDLLVPIVHETTYEALREVSPLLGSRSGLSTAEEPMKDIAAKLAELVAL